MTRDQIYSAACLTEEEIALINQSLGTGESVCGTTAFEKLYEYFTFETGEMPYGTAKARDGDPELWIFKRLES
jgi:hypothetical protein